MKCPCRGCTDRTMTCKYAGQCERWEKWKEYDTARREWLKQFKPINSERMEKAKIRNIKQKARGWKRSKGGNDDG